MCFEVGIGTPIRTTSFTIPCRIPSGPSRRRQKITRSGNRWSTIKHPIQTIGPPLGHVAPMQLERRRQNLAAVGGGMGESPATSGLSPQTARGVRGDDVLTTRRRYSTDVSTQKLRPPRVADADSTDSRRQ